MSIKSLEERSKLSQNKSPDLENYPHTGTNTQNKNPYIGLTLMEYFKLSHSKPGLEEIDQESNSSISGGTPCFGDFKDQISLVGDPKRKNRRDKVRTETEEELISVIRDSGEKPVPKISTINLEQNAVLDKNIVKLPSIYDYRHTNNSRQGMTKDGKIVNAKKQLFLKYKNEQGGVSSLAKNSEKGRIHEFQKNHQFAKKSTIRARVTSSSFYHMGTLKERERERIKTQQYVADRSLEKSFIVTKYGMSFGTKKTRDDSLFQPVKKHENTVKLIKNAHH